ncbi:MAG: bifunctional DNA primase/polymerase [Methylobacterium sp.]|nr:bifunctional DNA primase/polymerase [Cupriavidus sp.]MCA3654655.1 bifunctional DNA primase/polymerase [Methylobacterium sp.]MCA3676828.1 bifunctional DNA primase/polymerase [Methylobacterium sp.]MCA3681264.1 bifunctional DNA primase/polymerase [Methylobacterium sp.]MCA3682632.1 bifunctional DNA primase/polymerase [Methylobacterium sp.]
MSLMEKMNGPVSSASDGPGTPGERKETIGTVFGNRTDRIDNAAPLATSSPLKLDIIPLCASKDVDAKGRPLGKAPLRSGWRRSAPMGYAEVSAHLAKGKNVGARLREDQLVIDADPRNYRRGDDPLARLRRNIGLPDAPTVETGGGGFHIYLRRPAGLKLWDALGEYPGVEFKTLGRLVVVPPSIHPNGKHYAWDPLCGPEMTVPDAPDALIDLLRRPETASVASGGSWSIEQLSIALEGLDAREFDTNELWLPIAMAAHYETGGEGIDAFLDWCATDPTYADRMAEARARWDSFHDDRHDGYKRGTIFDVLHKAGRGDLVDQIEQISRLAENPADDFPPFDEADLPPSTGDRIDRMNERFCAVLDGGQFVVFMEDEDTAFDPPRKLWTRMSRESFKHYHEDERVSLIGSKREASIADLWLQSPRRRKYPGIVMDPEGRDAGGRLNIWRGWAIAHAAGDWSLMRELIEQTLCSGEKASFDYVMRWMAFMFQRPGTSPETAIAFRGEQGTGKGTLGRALMAITGAHGITVASPSQFAGRFNAHLRNAVFLFADEAFWPGHKEAEGVLKQLVTEPVISYEGKNAAIVQGRNLVHLMMASNNKWIVPASLDARRFAVFDVASNRQGDHDFFKRLNAQMASGGLAAMLHDLLAIDLGDWRPSRGIPKTTALAEQKALSLDPASRWWMNVLERGWLPFTYLLDIEKKREQVLDRFKWEDEPVQIEPEHKEELLKDFEAFLRTNRLFGGNASYPAIVEAGRKFGLEVARPGGKKRVWILPPLDEARRQFEASLGGADLFD